MLAENRKKQGKSVRRFPAWLKKTVAGAEEARKTRASLRKLEVDTVCRNARCPNVCECYAESQATFMAMGNTCTRSCMFCSVKKGAPTPLDPVEPGRIASAAVELGLRHVIVTSVTRDDLPDGGAGHFARIIDEIHSIKNEFDTTVEVLVPDFQGDVGAVRTVCASVPKVFGHNIETIPRLYSNLRPQADYVRSLEVLRCAKDTVPEMLVKSGLMIGLGETFDEIVRVMTDLHQNGVDICTIGQYLQPTSGQVPVEKFIAPDTFERLATVGEDLGLKKVVAAPFVRSSYRSGEILEELAKHS